jgi:hypothetical protein
MSSSSSRIAPEREALLRFFLRGKATQAEMRMHFDIAPGLAASRIGNAINTNQLRRVKTCPGQKVTPAWYEITDKGRTALDAIDNPVGIVMPSGSARKLRKGEISTPHEMAVGLQAERLHQDSQTRASSELARRLIASAPAGALPHSAPPQSRNALTIARAPTAVAVLPVAFGRDPCPRCGTRGDLPCKHRAADEGAPVDSFIPQPDGRTLSTGRTSHHLRPAPAERLARHG